MKSRIVRTQEGWAVELPAELIDRAGWTEEDEVELAIHPHGVLVRPTGPVGEGWTEVHQELIERQEGGAYDAAPES